ncbi:hypothetical protein GCM10010170_048840 [Dactylosporangium salmoneum]|uniref:Uncharacterized protein n=1 Tax=Dactylosporangium salmoneum TaxID=53361 RepID=A0ABP5TQ10_9ACTN
MLREAGSLSAYPAVRAAAEAAIAGPVQLHGLPLLGFEATCTPCRIWRKTYPTVGRCPRCRQEPLHLDGDGCRRCRVDQRWHPAPATDEAVTTQLWIGGSLAPRLLTQAGALGRQPDREPPYRTQPASPDAADPPQVSPHVHWLATHAPHHTGPRLDPAQLDRARTPLHDTQLTEALTTYRLLADQDGLDPDQVLADLLHLHHARMIGVDTASERHCLRLARAIPARHPR